MCLVGRYGVNMVLLKRSDQLRFNEIVKWSPKVAIFASKIRFSTEDLRFRPKFWTCLRVSRYFRDFSMWWNRITNDLGHHSRDIGERQVATPPFIGQSLKGKTVDTRENKSESRYWGVTSRYPNFAILWCKITQVQKWPSNPSWFVL